MIDFSGERLEELDIYAVGEVDMKGVAMLTVYCWSVCSISFFILLLISQSAQKSWDPWMFLSTWVPAWACGRGCGKARSGTGCTMRIPVMIKMTMMHDISWLMLIYADISLHILTSPDIGWHISTSPGIFWHLHRSFNLSALSCTFVSPATTAWNVQGKELRKDFPEIGKMGSVSGLLQQRYGFINVESSPNWIWQFSIMEKLLKLVSSNHFQPLSTINRYYHHDIVKDWTYTNYNLFQSEGSSWAKPSTWKPWR